MNEEKRGMKVGEKIRREKWNKRERNRREN